MWNLDFGFEIGFKRCAARYSDRCMTKVVSLIYSPFERFESISIVIIETVKAE